jgi:hypothetical protein
MAGKINPSILKNEIAKAELKSLEKEAILVANQILEEKKDEYLSEIVEHPISKEIAGGPDSANISNTLNGEGNLYTFIGFDAGDKPIEDLIQTIEKNTKLRKSKRKGAVFNFQVDTPSIEELRSYTPMPFEAGNSWLKGIEKGISGFSNYLYGLLFATSRSGKAIQSKNKIRRASYKPTKYFSILYRNFIESFKQ